MLSSLLALIERLSLFTTAATATAGLSLSLLGRANRNMVGMTVDGLCTMSAAMRAYFGCFPSVAPTFTVHVNIEFC